jgi:hypothetical protein
VRNTAVSAAACSAADAVKRMKRSVELEWQTRLSMRSDRIRCDYEKLLGEAQARTTPLQRENTALKQRIARLLAAAPVAEMTQQS